MWLHFDLMHKRKKNFNFVDFIMYILDKVKYVLYRLTNLFRNVLKKIYSGHKTLQNAFVVKFFLWNIIFGKKIAKKMFLQATFLAKFCQDMLW